MEKVFLFLAFTIKENYIKLSVIIVNYNVRHFLEQCLITTKKASEFFHSVYGEKSSEIFVVDNNSIDNSCDMVSENFPGVKLICNKDNLGFSKANNQAIRLCSGEYVLLLNPDTIVEEDTFTKVVEFMDNTPKAGALGVKMIDGKGNFLPESKRALPTPLVSLYKVTGLSKLFPKSKIFGKYHLGYLSKDKIHEIEILSGAFMLMRKTALDVTGLLDEKFFMYGEDIDLSYRIIKAGYKNYYFPETTIIHYKGESTKKGTLNYVFVFYNAMIIFAKKHFSGNNANLFILIIKIAIVLRASLTVVKQVLLSSFLPILDFALFYSGFFFLKQIWEHYKFPSGGTYPDEYMLYIVPAYIFVWMSSVYFYKGYRRPVSAINPAKGLLTGTIIILVLYSLLDEEFRFSRALIIIGTVWTFISFFGTRLIFSLFKIKNFSFKNAKKRKIAIVSGNKEKERILEILGKTKIKYSFVGMITPEHQENSIGTVDRLNETIKIYKIDELIFSLKDIGSREIIKHVLSIDNKQVDIKIAPHKTLFLIGSNSIHTSGDLYSIDFNPINTKSNLQRKRLLDISISVIFLLLSPIIIFLVKDFTGLIRNCINIIFGKFSWVGYSEENQDLPKIKKSIFSCADIIADKEINLDTDSDYAKNYKLSNDFLIIMKSIRNADRVVKK